MAIIVGFFVIWTLGSGLMVRNCYRKVPVGTAMVRRGLRPDSVSFSGMFVYPVIDQVKLVDVTVKRFAIQRKEREALVCGDGILADAELSIFMRVDDEEEAVLKALNRLGDDVVAREAGEEVLGERFRSVLVECLEESFRSHEFSEIYQSRELVRADFLAAARPRFVELGVVVDDIAIDALELADEEFYDESKPLQAEGLDKLKELKAEA